MPTFKRTEFVDARRFEGGGQNATDLLLWVHSNAGKAEWVEAYNKPQLIRLYDMPYSRIFDTAYVGDWIMQRQSGKFEIVRQQELDSDFEQV